MLKGSQLRQASRPATPTPLLLPSRLPRKRRKRTRWIALAALLVVIGIAVALGIALRHAEPLLKARVIETLSTRFDSRVELAAFHVSVDHGLRVYGKGLKIFGATDLNIHEPGIQPLISVDEFRFAARILDLLHTPMHIHRVYLEGLQINIPAKEQRAQGRRLRPGKIKIYMDEFVCEQAQIVINTLNPDKMPLQFDVRKLTMQEIGPGQPLRFVTTLINPKPVGEIESSGLFGPWQAEDPRTTALRGSYSFEHADLATIRGIGGTLSSTGQYEGTLGRIVVDGQTSTPDFQVAISGHPVPLHTRFHAIVDATSGNTFLDPVRARILNSSLVARGSVVREKLQPGHRVSLDVFVDHARIEDLLQLGVKTEPPLMTGDARLKTRFDLHPGEADIADRLRLKGSFEISRAHFTNEKIQSKVDALSMRGLGRPKRAKQDIRDVPSVMAGDYELSNGMLTFSELRFQMPGTQVDLTGKYSLDGNHLDFHGKARMQAKLSRMVGGWKSIFLKPVDPFFSKHGAGTEIPIKVTGTKAEPHFGLDFGHK